jgi:hypothetical protein
MARGWESKAVESQIETSQAKPAGSGKKMVSEEAAAAQRKGETLRLARTHLQRQLESSQHPRHREMLRTALTDLEKRLADLEAADGAGG